MNKTQVNKMMEECLFPDTCENSALLETHISWVVLTDQFAFKIKRPVKHSFLDFSTLEKRKHFAHDERFFDVLTIEDTPKIMARIPFKYEKFHRR